MVVHNANHDETDNANNGNIEENANRSNNDNIDNNANNDNNEIIDNNAKNDIKNNVRTFSLSFLSLFFVSVRY